MPYLDKATGVGTDIFIRKARPGATVGFGYFVDIYQNGVKIDTRRMKTKKDVLEVISDYKAKYHTDRAFQNELQVHITYKTKAERGETAMDNIEQVLYKKAATIEELMKRIVNPDSPVKTRLAANDVSQGVVDFVPETAPPEGTTDEVMSVEEISKAIATKIVEYFKELSPSESQAPAAPEMGEAPEVSAAPPAPAAPGMEMPKAAKVAFGWPEKDELYNTMKKWLSTVKKKVQDYAKSNESPINMDDVAKQVGLIVHSGDPAKIKQQTGLDVSPETAGKVKEITMMNVGNISGPGGERSPETLTEGVLNPEPTPVPQELPKAASAIDKANALTQRINTLDESMPIQHRVEDAMNDLNITNQDMNEIKQEIAKSPVQTEAAQAIQNYNTQDIKPGGFPGEGFDAYASEFWEYAGRNKVGYIEDIFVEWADKKDFNLKTAAEIWNKVSLSVSEMFGIREAGFLPSAQVLEFLAPIQNILITTSNAEKTQDYNKMLTDMTPLFAQYIVEEAKVPLHKRLANTMHPITQQDYVKMLTNEITAQKDRLIGFTQQSIGTILNNAKPAIQPRSARYFDAASKALRGINTESLLSAAISQASNEALPQEFSSQQPAQQPVQQPSVGGQEALPQA